MTTENLTYEDCLNFDPCNGDCVGPVEYRPAMSPTAKWFPRCERHFEERCETQRGVVRRYGGQMFYDGPSGWADEGYDY